MAQLLQVRVDEEIAASNSVLSQIGRTIYGDGIWFILLQVFTAGILILAANTAFQDFPQALVDPGAGRVPAFAVQEPRGPTRVLERGR